MFDTIPGSAQEAVTWGPEQYAPYYEALVARPLTAESIHQWLLDWSRISRLAYEVGSRLVVATSVDTTDAEAERLYTAFVEQVEPALRTYDNALNRKLLESGLKPDNFELPLRKIATDAALFREANLPLLAEENKLRLEFDKIIGVQTVQWEVQEVTLTQLTPIFLEADRTRRERAWRASMERRLQDREALNALWVRFMDLRGKIAANADQPDYRAYMWQAKKRFDYTPEDSITFQNAIEAVVVPAVRRIREKRRARLGLDRLRPWDATSGADAAYVDALGRPPLKPYDTIAQMNDSARTIFNKVDPALGAYFQTMIDDNLLDLDNRKGKAPGGYCIDFPVAQRPFIFMNAVGVHDDVQTLLHEGGHAFHAFETFNLPYFHQAEYPMEFAEVASMSMELIAGPYLEKDAGGYYDFADAARARVEHMENILIFWPYMAVVDAFQHWVYTNHQAASDPANCDAAWGDLWDRFIPGIDYTGLDAIKVTGWHRKPHIFQVPFYYVEYGLAQLGAVQVWANSLKDQAGAVRDYRRALALGGTAGLPDLFAAAGARFAFDADTLQRQVDLLEDSINALDPA